MIAFDSLKPMLLAELARPPANEDAYVAEPKFDGYRVMGQFGGGQCQLRSRNGANCTAWFQEVSDALATANCARMIVDGEMCILDQFGRSDFEALHARARRRRYTDGTPAVTYCVFDLLLEDGRDLIRTPLLERKDRLKQLMLANAMAHVLFVQHISKADVSRPVSWPFAQALAHQLEGIVGKRADSIYEPGVRTTAWFKLKRPGSVPAERFRR